jgi:hypothetical protein
MKFRRRVRLFPGVTLNFSRSGISTTVGVPGASVNFNRQGMFLNTGIPGTGIYDRKRIGNRKETNAKSRSSSLPQSSAQHIEPADIPKPITTENITATTTPGLEVLRDTLHACYHEQHEIRDEMMRVERQRARSQTLLTLMRMLLIGYMVPWFRRMRDQLTTYWEDLRGQLEECYVNIDFQTGADMDKAFEALLASYRALLTCHRIWDLTSRVKLDPQSARTAAGASITRRQVEIGYARWDLVESKHDALHFENANGADLYIYPAFLVILESNRRFGLIDLRELKVDYQAVPSMEEESVPEDAELIGSTWARVNKDGSPDRRFKHNYEIPLVKYGSISFKSDTGLHEEYLFSQHALAEDFVAKMKAYQSTLER